MPKKIDPLNKKMYGPVTVRLFISWSELAELLDFFEGSNPLSRR
jgi:hypothetical protein